MGIGSSTESCKRIVSSCVEAKIPFNESSELKTRIRSLTAEEQMVVANFYKERDVEFIFFLGSVTLDQVVGHKCYKIAAEGNHPEACYALAVMLLNDNPLESHKWMFKAVSFGVVKAIIWLGKAYMNKTIETKEELPGISLNCFYHALLCDKNNPDALEEIMKCVKQFPSYREQAVKKIEEAADLGGSNAHYILGQLIEQENVGDFWVAAEHYVKAIEFDKKNYNAMCALTSMPESVLRDFGVDPMGILEMAAKGSDLRAIHRLATIFMEGTPSITANKEKALLYLNQGASLKDPESYLQLGKYYYKENDSMEALKWFYRAKIRAEEEYHWNEAVDHIEDLMIESSDEILGKLFPLD
ncbi:MAG: hypothetical protein Harvfovirus18_11 [Harvfovirus sp.]|uniref:Sel1 repeat family protein n=1 Tax=Harvfovirus sp. TaxID=2487768 RepID=A0A3G5A5Q0_9VIRU|nr:MAG: hypothetical protein Harvfovirus18_11 [Harvfovirus sp.]